MFKATKRLVAELEAEEQDRKRRRRHEEEDAGTSREVGHSPEIIIVKLLMAKTLWNFSKILLS